MITLLLNQQKKQNDWGGFRTPHERQTLPSDSCVTPSEPCFARSHEQTYSLCHMVSFVFHRVLADTPDPIPLSFDNGRRPFNLLWLRHCGNDNLSSRGLFEQREFRRRLSLLQCRTKQDELDLMFLFLLASRPKERVTLCIENRGLKI